MRSPDIFVDVPGCGSSRVGHGSGTGVGESGGADGTGWTANGTVEG